MSNETQAVRIETGEEVAFELMKFIAEKENKNPAPEDVRDYYLDLLSNALTRFTMASDSGENKAHSPLLNYVRAAVKSRGFDARIRAGLVCRGRLGD
jgi:hypothetical protein